MKTQSILAVVAAIFATATSSIAQITTGWQSPLTSTTYTWSDPANWVDGDINGIFSNGLVGSGKTYPVIVFTNDATYPWVVEGDAAKSGNAGVASSTSTITTTATAAEGDIVQFDFKAWGEGTSTFWDHCDFYIDGTRVLYYGAYDND